MTINEAFALSQDRKQYHVKNLAALQMFIQSIYCC